jgi:nucleotide-binding universal stress UspA family protein
MFPIHTIVCPTDFFDCSRYAFRLASTLAREHNARLVVLHVTQMPGPEVAYGKVLAQLGPPEYRADLVRVLHRFQVPDSKVRVEHRLAEGDPAEEILRAAQDTGGDLIVMGTHGRRGLGRVLLGSVAEEVMRRASCPVLTVKLPSDSSTATRWKPTEGTVKIVEGSPT